MRSRYARTRSRWAALVTASVLTVLLIPSGTAAGATHGGNGSGPSTVAAAPALSVAALRAAPRAEVADAPSDDVLAGSVPVAPASSGSLSIVVTLSYSNQSRLTALLEALAQPAGSSRPPYLTAAEFDREFGASPSVYRAAAAYFGSFGVERLTTYANRAALSFQTSPQIAGEIFGTRLEVYAAHGLRYDAPVGPIELPAPIAGSVVQVVGLSTAPSTVGRMLTDGVVSDGARAAGPSAVTPSASGYLAPAQLGGAQIEYGPDLQVAYDEQTFLGSYGAPTNATIVLMTGGGRYGGPSNTTACGGGLAVGTAVGAWDPSDLSEFFAATQPHGQAEATVVGVPIDGAAAPGCLAAWDTTNTSAANTVDLEMIGSTAPGAQIYGVYGPNATEAELDQVFETVLSPGSSLGPALAAKLDNATVLVTPWGFQDVNDSLWFHGLEETAARGISVIAATGNAGDDPASRFWVGSQVEFPASMAYNTFGDTAVGGATVTLDAALRLVHQTAWYVSPKDVAQGGPAGTEGGPSQVIIKQPSWMKASSAGALLGSLGRGVPDLVALANDTAATVTIKGKRLDATNASAGGRFYNASGTGIAAALVAGEVAVINGALGANHDPRLGFPDPTVYPVANAEYAPLPTGSVHDSAANGTYLASTPTLPFFPVGGRNFADVTDYGYNLVTGWGSLDVYNFTMYFLVPPKLPSLGPLDAVEDWVNLTGLGVATGERGASVQQNTFVANSLGAPIAWVQSVLYLSARPNGEWDVNFTGWVVYPFFGLYPNQSVYDYWYPATFRVDSLPTAWDLTTTLTRATPSWSATVTFSFGSSFPSITLPIPGADYLIGSLQTTYDWQGTSYTDGPRGTVASVPGFLAPQVGVYAFPGSKTGNFTSATAGSIHAYVEPLGASTFEPARTGPVTLASTQTYETSLNLAYTETAPNEYALGYADGSTAQGITTTVSYPYAVEFSETGAPRSTTWSVALSNGRHLSSSGATSSLSTPLANGTYGWTATISSPNYTAAVGSGSFTVDGGAATVDLAYLALTDSVTFVASGGMTFPFHWSVEIVNGPTITGQDANLETNLTYAKYSYRISWTNTSWTPSRTTGTFTIGPTPATVQVDYTLETFRLKITGSYGIGEIAAWTVTVDGEAKSGPISRQLIYPLPNGTYSYSVTSLTPGFVARPWSGTVVVHGTPAPNVIIVIVPPPKATGLFGLGILGDALGVAMVAAVVAVALLFRRRRRRQKEAAKAAKAAEADARRPPPRARAPRPSDREPRSSHGSRGRPPRRETYVDPDQL